MRYMIFPKQNTITDKNINESLCLKNILFFLREEFEAVWTLDTAHYSVYNLDGEIPVSAGQCFVTSWLIKEYLESIDFSNDISVCRGALWHKNNIIIDNHCWVEMCCGKQILIVDLTQDQVTSCKVFICSKRESEAKGFLYNTENIYDDLTSVKMEAKLRVDILRERIRRNIFV